MYDFNLNTQLNRPQIQIRMSSGTESITNNQKGIIMLLVFSDFGFKDVVDFYLTEISVGLDDRHLEEGLELLVRGAHYWCVVLEVDLFAWADGVECLYRDVFGIPETQSDYIKYHMSSTNYYINQFTSHSINYNYN